MNSRYYKIFGPLNCDHIAKGPLDAINQFKFVDKFKIFPSYYQLYYQTIDYSL